jgi:hypothetical protein
VGILLGRGLAAEHVAVRLFVPRLRLARSDACSHQRRLPQLLDRVVAAPQVLDGAVVGAKIDQMSLAAARCRIRAHRGHEVRQSDAGAHARQMRRLHRRETLSNTAR